jgi:hypothetical protein
MADVARDEAVARFDRGRYDRELTEVLAGSTCSV